MGSLSQAGELTGHSVLAGTVDCEYIVQCGVL